MLEPTAALDRLSHALAAARRMGADAGDAIYIGDHSTSVQVRLGALEDVSRSEGEEIGIRLFIGQRSASVATSDLSLRAIDAAVERAVTMAREATEDPHAGLAPADRLLTGTLPELDLDDGGEVAPEMLRDMARTAEDAARAVSGITNSEGASASTGRACIALATSHGFAGAYRGSSHGLSASVIAGEGTAMQRDYAWHSARHAADLEAPEIIGRRAAERTVARLNPIRIETGSLPVVFDPRIGGSLIGHLLGAITGSAIARKTSFLLDARGQRIFAPGIRIIDNPLRPRGLRSRPFDGEGLATHETAIIDDGILTGWLMESASARQLGEQPTGHATRGTSGPPGAGATNIHMAPGTISRAALIGDIKRGLYITELIGMGVNGVTGDYSRGASGYLIDNGEIGPAVAEVTIAGNLKDMFKALTPADDLEFRHATNVPTIRIDGMTIAGA